MEKVGLGRLSPQTALVFRCFGVALGAVLLILMNPLILKEASSQGAGAILPFLIGGFLANFAGQLLFYSALKTGDVSRIMPIAGSFPLITFLLGVFLLGEAVSVHRVIGASLVLAGVALLR
jgi:transporter family protein